MAWRMIGFFFVLSVLFCSTIAAATGAAATCKSHKLSFPNAFPAILIFGDSTVDTGNNNFIPTLFRGNHRPYGDDWPDQIPTGRFSNGKLVPDFLASIFCLKDTVPPFLNPNLPDEELLTGVSFASAGSGLDKLTTALSGVIPMSKQTEYLLEYIQRLSKIVGESEARRIVSNALVIISAGTNDFVFNFYDIPTRTLEFNVSGYQDFLQNKLTKFIEELYHLGCRKMVVAGLPPIGCLPVQLTAKSSILRKCVDKENSDAQTYNSKLVKLLSKLQQTLRGSQILYANIYTKLIDMIKNPEKFGFVETSRGCCGTGIVEAGPLCNHLVPVCSDHSKFIFWDTIHPSETAYRYISDHLINEVLPHFS